MPIDSIHLILIYGDVKVVNAKSTNVNDIDPDRDEIHVEEGVVASTDAVV